MLHFVEKYTAYRWINFSTDESYFFATLKYSFESSDCLDWNCTDFYAAVKSPCSSAELPPGLTFIYSSGN